VRDSLLHDSLLHDSGLRLRAIATSSAGVAGRAAPGAPPRAACMHWDLPACLPGWLLIVPPIDLPCGATALSCSHPPQDRNRLACTVRLWDGPDSGRSEMRPMLTATGRKQLANSTPRLAKLWATRIQPNESSASHPPQPHRQLLDSSPPRFPGSRLRHRNSFPTHPLPIIWIFKFKKFLH
jgi:hypothetical protein